MQKMLLRSCACMFSSKINNFNILLSRSSSALFINGPKATENFVYITPYLDFSERLKQKDVVLNELDKRQVAIDLNKIEELWSIYEELNTRKRDLTLKREKVTTEIQEMLKKNVETNVEKLKIQLQLLKENIKKIKMPLWSAEEAAALAALKLPNILHSLTPDRDKEILFEHNLPSSNDKNHLQIGLGHNLINFIKNENYYLKGDAAIFELGAKFHFSKILKENNYIQFSNPDFVKSLIIEGCGEDYSNPDSTFILHHNEDTKVNTESRLHLTGAGSIYSFFAYHAKNVVHDKAFPLKYFSLGRQYVPSPAEEDSLFHVSQSSVVEIFVASKNNEELNKLFDEIIVVTKSFYTQFDYHFRFSLIPANKLKMWESLRLAIEMYSSSLKSYVEIGNISLSGDFIPKRLMFTYTEEKQMKFPHILSGTILNVPKFLACVLEDDKDFVLPEQFRFENWGIKTTA